MTPPPFAPRTLCTLLMLAMWCCTVTAQQAAPASADAARYWPLKQRRIDAYRQRDRSFMEQLLAPGFRGLGPDGRLVDRQQYLAAEFPAGATAAPPVETAVADFSATRSGDTLVLAYNETERSTVGGQVFQVRLARLDVYVRSGGRWLLQTMSAARLPEMPARIDLPPERLAEYAGVYDYGAGIISTVRLVDGRLIEQSTGSSEGELVPVGVDEFYSPPDLLARATFERDAAGRITTQVYRSGTQVLRARRRE